jgi:hypothetical protein
MIYPDADPELSSQVIPSSDPASGPALGMDQEKKIRNKKKFRTGLPFRILTLFQDLYVFNNDFDHL